MYTSGDNISAGCPTTNSCAVLKSCKFYIIMFQVFTVTGLSVPAGAVWEYGTPTAGWHNLPVNSTIAG